METKKSKIRLSDDDYLLLYPLMKPQQIADEFKQHSHCVSQIRNKYRKLRYGTQAHAYLALKKVALNDCPQDTPIHEWETRIEEEWRTSLQETVEHIWQKLRDREELLGASL